MKIYIILFLIVIIIILAYYNYFIYEKFNDTNKTVITNEMENVKNNPNDINKIKLSFDIILNLINDPDSKIKITNIYYNKLIPIINTNTNKINIARTKPPQNGRVTNHHDQSMWLVSFRVIKTIVNRPKNPIPPEFGEEELDI